MKQRTEEDELHNICKSILKEIEKWKKISQNGCNDPAWPDGANMNLLRNHIIYYKTKLYDLCEECGFKLPDEYYTPTPPEVDNCYMAVTTQKNRVKQLKDFGNNLKTGGKLKYDDGQMSLF